MMLTIYMSEKANALGIEFEPGTAGYAEELDENRIVDYSLNPGHPIGVSLHNVSQGVVLQGLPHPEQVKRILECLNIPVL